MRATRVLRRLLAMSPSRRRQWLTLKRDRFITAVFHARRLRRLGQATIVQNPLFWTPEFVELGNRVLIWPGCRIEGVSQFANRFYLPAITIGDNVNIQQGCHITFAGELVIGSDSAILAGALITDIDHSYHAIDINLNDQPIVVQTTRIGRFCVVGAGARILAGTVMGDNCVIGANSVVRGKFPDRCVIAGAPARIIRRFDPEAAEWRKTDAKGKFLDGNK
ncbi:acyltransferase [Sphingomonas sp. ac-8]|uniref:acyltransferase n=1 Tax=Sphingomonas sp. ac-8 TaxID=3242977 RepID=UPI003A801A89